MTNANLGPMTRRRALVFAGIALCGLWPAVARPSESRIFGKYRFAGGHKQRERFEAEVEDVVSQLNMLLRPIARKKIRESQAPAGKIEIVHAQGVVVVRREGAPEIRGRADAKPFTWKNRYGDELKIRMQLQGNTLELRFQGTQSSTITRYRTDDDGQRMVMRTEITDPRLPRAMRFTFTYKRGGADAE